MSMEIRWGKAGQGREIKYFQGLLVLQMQHPLYDDLCKYNVTAAHYIIRKIFFSVCNWKMYSSNKSLFSLG